MQPFSIGDDDDNDKLTSLAVVLPLAVVGFVIAAGCWTIFAVAGAHLRNALGLGSLEFGLLLATPMAAGALLAVPAGIAAQKLGARRVMIACLLGLSVSMALLLVVETWAGYLLVAAGLGLAGGFYSAGLQFVTSHASSRHMGLVLGVFGAGVTGAGFNYYLVPLIVQAFSWKGVPLAYLVVLLLVTTLLVLLTDDSDSRGDPNVETSARQLLRRLENLRVWRLYLYFGVVAGSFFSLALWLPDFMASRFLLTMESGARLALWFVIPGALAQILGGGLSDRYGAGRVVVRSLVACLAALFVLSYPPMTLSVHGIDSVISLELSLPLFLEAFFIVLLGIALGSAMGGLQRMVVEENREAAAFAAGMLLFSACLVAFLLPVLFGAMIHWVGVGTAMFMILFVLLTGSLFMFARDYRREERRVLLHKGV
ncbi:NarK/NasA family nitrate transporter [Marinobacter panjinensis]|uniref:NarK/NasA family nitrate transporter n=1 Tax=Marinobacter panjinensis TaxID=2576384 RepID=A0A4U6R773_9GAMM|nr:MFS transporter [Marinobacter panjinensis]MCR8913167.1 MFS transporter [Marinobacter panjinensis]TKV68146.1 NarK/NasA family nitrate transporter [Marinobacter panjinensis]